ncbi:MAG: hypothetical protein ACLSHG_03160 [Oscillospiraceae bacterium]
MPGSTIAEIASAPAANAYSSAVPMPKPRSLTSAGQTQRREPDDQHKAAQKRQPVFPKRAKHGAAEVYIAVIAHPVGVERELGKRTVPVEKAIPSEQKSVDLEHLSHWLDKYDGKVCARRLLLPPVPQSAR